MYDVVIIGGGIVGLSTTFALANRFPKLRILVIEKEKELGVHQTGHNSGVIHSGIYYKPGSLKAKLAVEGNKRMYEFCQQYGIPYEQCGKVIVATDKEELPQLQMLYERGLKNGVPVEKLNRDELREIEPHVQGIEAIHVKSVGIVDFRQICFTLATLIRKQGVEIALENRVVNIEGNQILEVQTDRETYKTRFLINCAGLFSDRVAKLAGLNTDVKIVPFRGEFYKLKDEKKHLVKHLIYPVPNPNFPFLGVHFTRTIHGYVKIGPNAVLGLKREAYKKTDINLRDLGELMIFPGLWKLASHYWREGMHEYARSFSKSILIKEVQRFFPDIRKEDLLPAPSGVRAQALTKDGKLVDDFYIINHANQVHVCNAPSPAATAALVIGETIVSKLLNQMMAYV